MSRKTSGRRPRIVPRLLRLEDRITPSFANPVGLTPDQIRRAYGIDSIFFDGQVGNGAGQTIAIVAAYDNPNIHADLATFKATFGTSENGLNARPAQDVLTKVNQRGGLTLPRPDPEWATEIALDVQWAHAIAPMANIVLVLADSPADADMLAAVRYAATIPGVSVVSSSFGRGELPSDWAVPELSQSGVTFVFSAGDTGRPTFPGSLANVLTVGGTRLSVAPDGTWLAEGGWTYTTFTDIFGAVQESGGGGGVSMYQPRPSYQDGLIPIVGEFRGTPDVAYNADPATGFAVVNTYANPLFPWRQVGGTSAGAPQWAALIAIANQGRALNGLAPLNTVGGTRTLDILYEVGDGYFRDITTGRNAAGDHAGPGYDLLTGRGSPIANVLIPRLAGYLAEPTVTISAAPSLITLGGETTLSVTVTGNPRDGTPTGTVRFMAGEVDLGSATLVGGTATLVTTLLPHLGAVTVTAGYLGDSSYRPAEAAQTLTVQAPSVAVTISLPIEDVTYGQTVQLTAVVEGEFGTPTGSVTFWAGSTVLGTAPLIDGIAILDTSALPAGEAVRVSAVYSGDTEYTTSLGVGTLAVAKAKLRLRVSDVTRQYGQVNPAFTITTGDTLYNGDTLETILTGSAATTATTTSDVGVYPITQGNLAAANYELIWTDGVLTVTPAKLFVSVMETRRAYGAGNPGFTLSVTGLLNGDTIAQVMTGAPATLATATSPVGWYPITLGTLTAKNYDIIFGGGLLEIVPAPLFVSVENVSRVYGHANPEFRLTIAGLVNGDTAETVLSGTVSTPATIDSSIGQYVIELGTLRATPNYVLHFQPGVLTVTQATLTVHAHDTTIVYGSPLPVIALTARGLLNGDTLDTAVTGSAGATGFHVGSHAITIGTLASTNYSLEFVGGTLTVLPAPLTVRADNQTRTYGSTNPILTFTVSGFVNGDNAATALTGFLQTQATLTSAVGDYAITQGTLSASNYTITFINSVLRITPAPLTIRADDVSRTYGETNPPLTATMQGLVAGDTPASAVSGTLATEATARSPVGVYSITAGQLSAPNYIITLIPGRLTILPAPLIVTADSVSRHYGSSNPALTYTVSGLRNQDAPSITGTPVTTATIDSDVGTYPISLGTVTNTDPNYSLVFVPGTLTVTPASLVVSVNPTSRTVNQPNPVFTVSYSGFVNGDSSAVLTGSAVFSTTATANSRPGQYPILASGLSSANYTLSYRPGTLTVEPVRYDATVFGTGASALIVVLRPNGTVASAFRAFEPTFTGPVSLATADITGDGYEDIIVGAGAGGGPRVRVFSGVDFRLIMDFFAYESTFRGGVHVAAGDVDGDGYADIVCGAGDQGAPAVRVFSGYDGRLLQSFFAYEETFRSGVTVAVVDLEGDGRFDIVTGAGAGGGPVVKIFDGVTGALVTSYYAFDPDNRRGVSVAGGRGWVAAGHGSGSTVEVRHGSDLSRTVRWMAFDPSYDGGVQVSEYTGDRLAVAPTVRGNQPPGLWDPITGIFLGGVPVS